MSAAHETPEQNARLAACDLLMDALDDVPGFTPVRSERFPAEAVLIAAHAIVAKLDVMETTHLEAMRNLQESIDCMGAQSNDNELALTPTAHESEVMYRALEEDYLRNHQAANIDEMDAHLRRFRCLAGC